VAPAAEPAPPPGLPGVRPYGSQEAAAGRPFVRREARRRPVLSREVTVPGTATRGPLPAPTARVGVDGYTVTVKGGGSAGRR
jgi:hypothetical protein